nr:ATP-binding protein [uncultured Dyadobacter sp.]
MMDLERNATLEFLAGGGEMGRRIREFDWESNALGSPTLWPESLKTCVRIMLSSQQPIWIGWGDQLIKLYNDAYIDIVRGKHPTALGEPASVVWKDIWKDIEPLLSRAMLRDEGTYVESRLLIMERSGFPEETYYTFSYTPVLGDNGRPAGIICYNTADTERIINERALKTMQQLDSLGEKKSEQEVFAQVGRALSANPHDFPFALLYRVGDDGTHAHLVAASGVEPTDPRLDQQIALSAENSRYEHLVSSLQQNRVIEAVNRGHWNGLAQGSWDVAPRYLVYIPVQSASRKSPLALLAIGLSPYRKFDDTYRNFLQQIADRIALGLGNVMAYEEEQRRLRALEELDKAKTLFFTNISHEFRTPLMLMLGPLEELLAGASGWQDAERDKVEVTHRNALRLLKLVNTLLDFSRIESGRGHADFTRTDVAAYTRDLASNFRSVIEKAGMVLEVRTGDSEIPAYLDRQMWEKIVFNLLSNAFKYTLEGKITLDVAVRNGEVLMSVTDTGVGIPADELPHLFERFHRVRNSAGRTYEGTGIGLSLAKELVALHGGTIGVESTMGEGSRFTVTIPVGKTHLEPDQVHEAGSDLEESISDFYVREAETLLPADTGTEPACYPHPTSFTGKDCILIADDNADMREHIRSLIGNDYRPLTAGNGREALDMIRKYRPALVLSDIMMPEMDGIALLKAIKADPEIADTPVILITARAGEESRIEGFEIGADDYMVKPFSSHELLARTHAQIRMSKARKRVENRLGGFLMQMPAAVAVLEGPDFRCTLANAMFQQFSGMAGADIKGKPFAEAFPGLTGQGWTELLASARRTGQPVYETELEIYRKKEDDARSGFYDLTVYPVRNDEGEAAELMLHIIDVSRQVEARSRIMASEEQFRTLTETLPQLVWMTDHDGRQLFASGRWAEYAGVVPQGPDSWQQIVHPADYRAVTESWLHSLETGSPHRMEVRLKNTAGEYRWHAGQGEPIRNEAGRIINWIGTFSDIHDQRMFTEELERKVQQRTEDLMNANKELESFNYVASHDLQEPLRKIQTFIHLIEKNSFDSDRSKVYFEKITSSAQRMGDLIQSVLSYSRLSKNGEALHPVDLNKVIDDIRNDFELAIDEKQAVLHAEGLPVIRANVLQMNQLFSNLISNALKFSAVQPLITIRCQPAGGAAVPAGLDGSSGKMYHHITVADNGIGFEPEFREKIFKLFQRLHGRHEYAGTGIGLSIVKKIVEQHDGYISAESQPGQGAVFHIWLPA